MQTDEQEFADLVRSAYERAEATPGTWARSRSAAGGDTG